MNEIWQSVEGWGNRYEVSSFGNARALNPGKCTRLKNANYPMNLSPVIWDGYRYVTLCCNGKARQYKVAHLVLMAFQGLCPTGHECAHLNGRSIDDRFVNLAWVTHGENISHKIIHNTMVRGEDVSQSVLTEGQIHEIRELLTQRTRKWDTLSNAKIGKMFGVAKTTIQAIDSGKTWAWLAKEGHNAT